MARWYNMLLTIVVLVLAVLVFALAHAQTSAPSEPPPASFPPTGDAPATTLLRHDIEPYFCRAVELIKGDSIDLDNPEATTLAILDMHGHWIVYDWPGLIWAASNADQLTFQCIAGELLKRQAALTAAPALSDGNCARSIAWIIHDDPIMRLCVRGLKP